MKTMVAILLAAVGVAVSASSTLAVNFCQSNKDRNCFTGSFGLVDIPGDASHKLLKADFGYVDLNGVGWQTNKETKTDNSAAIATVCRFPMGRRLYSCSRHP